MMGGATSNVRTNITLAQHTSAVQTTVISEYKFKNDLTPSSFKTKQLKVVLVGAPRVGKTSLVQRWLHNTFDSDISSYIPTTKVDLSLKLITFNDTTLRVEIWDTPSHPDIRDIMLDHYYRDADIVLLVGDVTKPASFRDLQNSIVPKLKKYCNRHYKGRLPIVLFLANKNDTQYDSPEMTTALKDSVSVNAELCAVLGDGMGANMSVLVSAKHDWGVDEALERALHVACSLPPRVWEPLSEAALLREQQEEEEAQRLQRERELEAARIAEEEEKEIRKMEKEMLKAEGFEVSDDEEEGEGEDAGTGTDTDAEKPVEEKKAGVGGVGVAPDMGLSIRVSEAGAAQSTPDLMRSSFGDSANIDKIALPIPALAEVAEDDEDEESGEEREERRGGKGVRFADGEGAGASDGEFDEEEGEGGAAAGAAGVDEFDDDEEEEGEGERAVGEVKAAVEDDEFDEEEEDGNGEAVTGVAVKEEAEAEAEEEGEVVGDVEEGDAEVAVAAAATEDEFDDEGANGAGEGEDEKEGNAGDAYVVADDQEGEDEQATPASGDVDAGKGGDETGDGDNDAEMGLVMQVADDEFDDEESPDEGKYENAEDAGSPRDDAPLATPVAVEEAADDDDFD